MKNPILNGALAMMMSGIVAASTSAQTYIDPATGRTLDQLIEQAFAQSPELAASRAEIDIARGELQQAGLRPNPRVTAGRREEPAGADNQTSVMFQLPLDLFRRQRRVDTATERLAAVEQAVKDRERLLAAAVRERAGAVLVAARLLAVTDDLLQIAQGTLKLLAARAAEGASPPLERDVAEVEVRRLEAERALRIAEIEAALVDLKAVLGLRPDAPLSLRDDLEQQLRRDGLLPDSVAIEQVVSQRPDVQEAAARVRVSDARIRQLQREGRFDLDVYGSYMRMNAGFPQRAFAADGSLEPIRGLFHYVEAGGMLMLPLFNRNQGAIAAAEAERKAADRTREARELAARAEITAARTREVELRKSFDLFARAREQARRNAQVVRESYQLGRNTLFEVFEAERRLLEVETAYTEALGRAFEARTAFIRAIGTRP
jgi:cobalt-zinc-cadmium efflux system outer membrane protein